jgi:hypothetical protein
MESRIGKAQVLNDSIFNFVQGDGRKLSKEGSTMDMKKWASIGIWAGLIFTMVVILGNPGIAGAQEKCLPVYIRSHAGIEPETLNVTKGDCVVWINWTRGEDVRVIFREGKKCADMTKAPVRFKQDFSGCYLTDYLNFGETSSLVFAEAGKFDYEVEFGRAPGGLYGPGRAIISGSISVK